MSFIDFNGKLFGKINIVDLMIILILVFGLIFAGRLIYKLSKSDEKWVVINLRFDNLPNEVANSIEVGYVEKIASKIVAEVLDIKFLLSPNVLTKSILLKVKLLVKLENNELIHNKRNLMVGTYRSFTLGPFDSKYDYVYLYNGLILDIDRGLEEKKTEKIVEMKLYNQDLWVNNAIKIGGKEVDYQNETIAEVLSKQVKSAEFIYVIENTGEVLVRESPIREDIILRLKLYGKIGENDVFIFKYNKILIGKEIILDLDRSLFLGGVITKIE